MADQMSDTHVQETRRAIEAVLMVAELPVEPQLLAQLLEVPVARIGEVCRELAAEYEATDRGYVLVQVAGGWRFQSHPDMAPYVERFVLEGQSARLSGAALETLAIVAYKQPVSRARVSAIRGVNVDGVMRTLLTRGLVEEAGQDESSGANLYRTTGYFLERIGVTSIDELPELAPYLPDLEDMADELENVASTSDSGPAVEGSAVEGEA
jgi:segregation and condensation protein B